MSDLTDKQRRFVEEYLVDLNATRAAMRAGYSEHSARRIGYENLGKPEIADAIAAAIEARSARVEITQDQVVRELARIAFADIRHVVRWGEGVPVRDPETGEERIVNGVSLVSADAIGADAAAAIAEISEGRDGALRVKMHSKPDALAKLGQHLGMFVQRVEATGKDGKDLIPESAPPEKVAQALLSIVNSIVNGEDTDHGLDG